MGEPEKEKWREVLRASLRDAQGKTSAAVPGAKLRGYLVPRAALSGLSLPTNTKFGDFLDGFPDVLAILKRPARDFLVAPANAPQLLAQQNALVGIRSDMFEAFTQVRPGKLAWYFADDDRLIWLDANVVAAPNGFVRIPPATFETETELRRDFAASVSPPLRADLLSALENPRPLAAFSLAVKKVQLNTAWHVFRSEMVVKRIRDWAAAANLQWRDAWLTSTPSPRETAHKASATRSWRGVLTSFIESLDEVDLARISVPMDLVAKALVRP